MTTTRRRHPTFKKRVPLFTRDGDLFVYTLQLCSQSTASWSDRYWTHTLKVSEELALPVLRAYAKSLEKSNRLFSAHIVRRDAGGEHHVTRLCHWTD